MSAVASIIEEYLLSRLGDNRIADLKIVPAEDENGDPIVRIDIIYREAVGLLDTTELLDLAIDLRTALESCGDEAYPILSYISDSDAGHLTAAE